VVIVICSGHLQANRPSIGSASSYQHVFFKMDVPKAQNVAVVVGTEWTQLDQKEPGSWHGEVIYRHSISSDCVSPVLDIWCNVFTVIGILCDNVFLITCCTKNSKIDCH